MHRYQRLLWIVGLSLLAIHAGRAIAQTPAERTLEPPATEPPSQETNSVAPEPETFETYTLPNTFSLTIPQGWFVEEVASENYALITSYAPDTTSPQQTDIRTAVLLVDEPPETFVEREIDALIQGGYNIDSYGVTVVEGNTGFRLWIIELPGEFTNQVITFIGYETGKTAKLVSYFNDTSTDTIDTLVNLHQSFELIN